MPFSLMDRHGQRIPYTRSVFSGGEIQIRLDPDRVTQLSLDWEQVTITAHMRQPSDVMELCMLANAVTGCSWERPNLIIPYVPYARQDRVCQPGEDFALKTFADILNGLRFKSIEAWDVHSEVTKTLIPNLLNIEANIFVNRLQFERIPLVVAPDKGAVGRARKVDDDLSNYGVIQALKVRAADNSSVSIQLEHPEVNYGDEDFLIVDDICDGGRTFIELAKVLRPRTRGKIFLYVTHGIFSNGLAVFNNVLDAIYCPNIWSDKPVGDAYDEVLINRLTGV